MGARDRRERRGEEPADPVVYRMRVRLMDLRADYWVQTSDGRTVYQVDGKAVRFREAFTIRDAGGMVVARLTERLPHARDTMTIDRPGRPSATIRKAVAAPMPERFVVEADDVGTIDVRGDVVDHEYTFERDGQPIAQVSRRWMTVLDTFGVQVQPGADPVLVLAATAALDAMGD
jgi:uncharacterized protein YxjI